MEKADRTQFSKTRLLVVGDVMLDRYWFGDTGRISPEAPVPVVQVEKIDERLGGAANVARNASALGAQTTILGVVGEDEAGKRVEQLLLESGVQSQLQTDGNVPTTVKLRVIARQQQLIRLDFEEAPSQISLDAKLKRFKSLLPNIDIVILSDYGKGALEQVSAMIELANASKKLVLVDPKGDAYDKYKGATVLTPNRSELRQVVGQWSSEDDLTLRAQSLRKNLGLGALLLTRSEEGMTLFTDKGTEHVRAQAREVFDVSGAGDTVIAALAVAMGAGWSLERAMALANRAGGIVVGKLGTATVSAEELQ
ncbi:MAG: D-glycero-beta-D-manno-heptose-7-phosphate kinase [Limnohabitans sp.]|nr:D-glycero-beta-D-manno-heptose-7-phosphate kinase [Limnohabitans sp.]